MLKMEIESIANKFLFNSGQIERQLNVAHFSKTLNKSRCRKINRRKIWRRRHRTTNLQKNLISNHWIVSNMRCWMEKEGFANKSNPITINIKIISFGKFQITEWKYSLIIIIHFKQNFKVKCTNNDRLLILCLN